MSRRDFRTVFAEIPICAAAQKRVPRAHPGPHGPMTTRRWETQRSASGGDLLCRARSISTSIRLIKIRHVGRIRPRVVAGRSDNAVLVEVTRSGFVGLYPATAELRTHDAWPGAETTEI